MRKLRLAVSLLVAVAILASGQIIRAGTVPELPEGLTEQISAADGLAKVILDDGHVTKAELERAIRAAVTCMEDAGLQVSLDLDLEANAWAVQFNGGPTEQTLAVARQLVDNCEAEHLHLVSNVHAFQERPSQDEFLAEYARIAACLRAKGVPVRDDSVEAVADSTTIDIAAYTECSKDL